MTRLNRRRFVLGTGGLTLSAGFAGCSSDDTDPDEGESDDGTADGGSDPEDEDEDESEGDDRDDVDDDTDDGSADIDGHLANTPNYDGEIESRTGEDEIGIEVGDPAGGTEYVFEPPAVEIDEGTTVVWEWIDGDPHSVTHTEGDAFDSGTDDSSEFEHTFDAGGTYLYHCTPHRDMGQRGAIVVV